ncbi:MAG: hypothetical protein WCR66_09880 [Bacteroidota bacterium]
MKWLKVTQKGSKNIFQKKINYRGYLLCPFGINCKLPQNKKKQKMKKVLFVVALGAFAACGTGANTAAKVDSMAAKVDSTVVKVDSTVVKVDSAVKAVVDTLKKK